MESGQLSLLLLNRALQEFEFGFSLVNSRELELLVDAMPLPSETGLGTNV